MFDPAKTPPARADRHDTDSAIYRAAELIQALIPLTFVAILICAALS